MTAFSALNRLGREIGRMLAWGVVGAGIAAMVGVWAGLWFGGYQAFKHDDVARFWPAFTACVALSALSGAITGVLAFFADGAILVCSAEEMASKSQSCASTPRIRDVPAELPAPLAARMRLDRHTLTRIARGRSAS